MSKKEHRTTVIEKVITYANSMSFMSANWRYPVLEYQRRILRTGYKMTSSILNRSRVKASY